jgi:hypothetical protein
MKWRLSRLLPLGNQYKFFADPAPDVLAGNYIGKPKRFVAASTIHDKHVRNPKGNNAIVRGLPIELTRPIVVHLSC